MSITITLKDYEELISFAETVLAGTKREESTPERTANTPGVSFTPAQTESAGQPDTPISPTTLVVPTTTPTVPPTTSVQTAGAMVPTSVTSYTIDDLSDAAVTLMESGRQTDLQQLLQNFGVISLPELPSEKYGEFATALRGMGAPI